MQLLRVTLLLLALFFSHFLGRAGARLHQSRQPYTRALTWILRTVVALGAIVWTGGLDALSIAAVVLCAASFAWGVHREQHPPRPDEFHLTQ
jgi:hypothetical protein